MAQFNKEVLSTKIFSILPRPDLIKEKIYKYNSRVYRILNYKHDTVNTDIHKLGIYRSIVMDDDKLLSFSLPKSIKYEEFKLTNNLDDPNLLVTEIIEGTMINMFYNGEEWNISTKSAIGGDYFYYRKGYDNKSTKENQLTFKKMFMECLREDVNTDLSFFSKNLSTNCCYSFVMQHPDNHIVLNNIEPKLYLVAVFEINDNSATYIPFNTYVNMNCVKSISGLISFPKTIDKLDDYKNMELKYTKDSCDLILGLMYLNEKTGERAHAINETYNKMKNLRGNNPNLQYQYLCLKKIGKVKEFLEFFPQYKGVFYKFYTEYKNFLTNLHQCYLSFYIQKNGERINKKYFYHIYKIHHEFYLPSLNTESKKIMNKSEIYNYFETYDPIQQLHYLNYNENTANKKTTKKNTTDENTTNENTTK